jgi:hypothetical protein
VTERPHNEMNKARTQNNQHLTAPSEFKFLADEYRREVERLLVVAQSLERRAEEYKHEAQIQRSRAEVLRAHARTLNARPRRTVKAA